jgi:hypothetical protein
MPRFPDTLEAFLDAHSDLFSEEERALITHDELIQGRGYPDLLAAIVNLYATKLDERQAESNERYASAMTWLTIALFVAAAFEAAGTVVSALIALGAFG